jgi:hypothetical protein
MAECAASKKSGGPSRRGLLAAAGAVAATAALGPRARAHETKGGSERHYEGDAAENKLQAALDEALKKLEKDLPEGHVADASATWRLLDVAGESGGLTGARTIRVRIAATRTPPWPRK